jgi:hypothetical protein
MPSVVTRTNTTFMLEIDGQRIGPLLRASGGELFGSVAQTAMQPGPFPKKHIADLGVRPLELVFDTSVQPALLEWIGQLLAGTIQPRDGALVELDFNMRERSRLEFRNAWPTYVALPDLDASSKEVATFTLHLQPESIRRVAGSGAAGSVAGLKAKRALASAFRLKLDGEVDARRVAKIQAPRLTVTVSRGNRSGALEFVRASLSNLFCTTAVDESWWALADRFLAQGNNAEADELTGTLELLSADMKTVLLSVGLDHVGLVSVSRVAETESSSPARLTAEFYVEQMKLAGPGVSVPVKRAGSVKAVKAVKVPKTAKLRPATPAARKVRRRA